MRSRYFLLVLFGFLALAPMVVFGLWSYSNVLRTEFEAVEDRHLLLARNLGSALERYHEDIVSVFDLLSHNLVMGRLSGNADSLLANLHIECLCVADAQSGVVVASAITPGKKCPQFFDAALFEKLNVTAVDEETHFTEVMSSLDGTHNIIFAVQRIGDKLAVGTIATDYFVTLGKSISFGVKGHAAIVDHAGNVLAHPLDDWVAARKNIAGVSAVQRMFKGETGIEQFYSPALKGDMIAGFTTVPGPGWGVMIPQPVVELYQKAAATQSTALTILISSLAFAAAISLYISIRVADPLERVIRAAKRVDEGRSLEEISVAGGPMVPSELVELQDTYNRMVQSLNRSQGRIRRLAYTDSVTALPNRESFRLMVIRQLGHLAETGGRGAMIFIDIDNFKIINDTLGHDRGDQVLRALADRISNVVREVTGIKPVNRYLEEGAAAGKLVDAPIVGRIGGDEFTVFIPNLSKDLKLEKVLSQIRAEMARPLPDLGADVHLSAISGGASIGAACFPRHGGDFETLLKLADIAMYHAKRNGKNRAEIFRAEIGDVSSTEMRMEVSRGLKQGEFILHYQPKVNSQTGSITSVEALIRWQHPERGLLGPNVFIPLIEETDVIIEVGEWVLNEAALQISRWEEEGLELDVAVNIATRHFGTKGFARQAKDLVRKAGIDPSRIELEITEETVLASMDYSQSIIANLQKLGFKISLDDFGRGYSNLTRLANLEVNTIKIDGPLTAGVTEDGRTRVIVASTIEMAHGLGCTTVAEGVETLEQAVLLRKLGCESLQGFYFARPMEGTLLSGWLQDRRGSKVLDLRKKLKQAI